MYASVLWLFVGTPLLLALTAPTPPAHGLAADALPATFRALKVAGGCAADYDTWLIGATA